MKSILGQPSLRASEKFKIITNDDIVIKRCYSEDDNMLSNDKNNYRSSATKKSSKKSGSKNICKSVTVLSKKPKQSRVKKVNSCKKLISTENVNVLRSKSELLQKASCTCTPSTVRSEVNHEKPYK